VLAPLVRAHLVAHGGDVLATPDALNNLPFADAMRQYPVGEATALISPEDEPPLLATTMRLVLKDRVPAAVRRTLDLAAPPAQVDAFASALSAIMSHPYGAAASLKRAVSAALDEAFVAEIALVQLPTAALRATMGNADMREFAMAQFRKGVRLLRNMMALSDVADAGQLRERALGELLNRHLLPFLRNVDFATPAAALAALQPLVAAVPRAVDDRVPADLAMLHQFVWLHFQLAARSPQRSGDVVRGFEDLLRALGGLKQ